MEYLYRLKNNKFEKVILLDTFESQFESYPLISNDTHFYIGNTTSFNYNNIKYGKCSTASTVINYFSMVLVVRDL